MRDADVRKVLNQRLLSFFLDDPDTLVINEFGVCQGEARIDVAVINGNIHGFEIKSESDTLERLPTQQEFYNKVFDTVTIVSGAKHLKKIKKIVPKWWGIIQARQIGSKTSLTRVREAGNNPNIDPFSLVQLLWHNEALAILEEHDMAKGMRSKPRRYVWASLASNIPLNQLSTIVRNKLKKRDSLKQRDSLKAA